jgi:hypothetical protein
VDRASSPEELVRLESLVAAWLADQEAENPVVAAVERDPEARRWYVRVLGEDKDVYSIWFTLGQRTLHFETYFMPAPVENAEACYSQLLRRNAGLYGIAFSIGAEEAIFLSGQLANDAVTASELDRILGTFYATVELCFLAAVRLGFASQFGSAG